MAISTARESCASRPPRPPVCRRRSARARKAAEAQLLVREPAVVGRDAGDVRAARQRVPGGGGEGAVARDVLVGLDLGARDRPAALLGQPDDPVDRLLVRQLTAGSRHPASPTPDARDPNPSGHNPSVLSIDAIIDELYALPPEEFTPARNAAAAGLRKEGRRAEAAVVLEQRKPTAAAARLERLVRDRRRDIEAFLAAAARTRDAQLSGKG